MVLQSAGRHVRQGERWRLQRLATWLPWPGAGWDSVAAQQITELLRVTALPTRDGADYLRLEHLAFTRAGRTQRSQLVRACRVGELTPRVRAEAAAMRRPAPPGF